MVGADPAHAGAYLQRFGRYKAELDALDRRGRERLAYGVTCMAPEGLNTASERSAKTVAGLIRQICHDGIKAFFLENISDPRLMEIARETGAGLCPQLHSDALSGPDGPAPTYIRMIEYNTAMLQAGMLKN